MKNLKRLIPLLAVLFVVGSLPTPEVDAKASKAASRAAKDDQATARDKQPQGKVCDAKCAPNGDNTITVTAAISLIRDDKSSVKANVASQELEFTVDPINLPLKSFLTTLPIGESVTLNAYHCTSKDCDRWIAIDVTRQTLVEARIKSISSEGKSLIAVPHDSDKEFAYSVEDPLLVKSRSAGDVILLTVLSAKDGKLHVQAAMPKSISIDRYTRAMTLSVVGVLAWLMACLLASLHNGGNAVLQQDPQPQNAQGQQNLPHVANPPGVVRWILGPVWSVVRWVPGTVWSFIRWILRTLWSPTTFIVGEDNRYSNSKFQTAIWFFVLVVGYVAAIYLRYSKGGIEFVGIGIPENLLILSGVSTLTVGSAKAITSSKAAAAAAAGAIGKEPGRPRLAFDLSHNDIGAVDLGDFQMVVLTLLALGVFLVRLWHFLGVVELAKGVSLPDLDSTILVTTGLSLGAYLAKKGFGKLGQA